MAVDMVLEHLHGSLIITTFRNNNIRVFLAGLHKLLMHRFHRIHILVDDGFQASGPLENVSLETADQTDIGTGRPALSSFRCSIISPVSKAFG